MNTLSTTGRIDYDLSGSTAVVTGAAGDFGRVVSVELARAGAKLGLLDLGSARQGLDETVRACADVGNVDIEVIECDVTDERAVADGFATTRTALGTPDLVFNNAGYQGVFALTPDYPIDDLRRVLDVNVVGMVNVLKAASSMLRTDGASGSIVNSASMAGVAGAVNMIAYCASKGAAISLTKAASRDLAHLGIRVNAISPAFIGPGAMWTRQVELQAQAGGPAYSSDPATVADEMVAEVPLGRVGTVDEVAAAVMWLLSPASSYVTGENILISGGIL